MSALRITPITWGEFQDFIGEPQNSSVNHKMEINVMRRVPGLCFILALTFTTIAAKADVMLMEATGGEDISYTDGNTATTSYSVLPFQDPFYTVGSPVLNISQPTVIDTFSFVMSTVGDYNFGNLSHIEILVFKTDNEGTALEHMTLDPLTGNGRPNIMATPSEIVDGFGASTFGGSYRVTLDFEEFTLPPGEYVIALSAKVFTSETTLVVESDINLGTGYVAVFAYPGQLFALQDLNQAVTGTPAFDIGGHYVNNCHGFLCVSAKAHNAISFKAACIPGVNC